MNVLATFESTSLMSGLSKYEDEQLVRVAITLVLQWVLNAVHQKLTTATVIENTYQIISDTYVYAEHMTQDCSVIDNVTGMANTVRFPLLHSEDKNYGAVGYNTSKNWYHRYAEIVEHIVTYYAHAVMGFIQTLEHDLHVVVIRCLHYTDRYIATYLECRNLIEYADPSRE